MWLPASCFRKCNGLISLLDQSMYLARFERLDCAYLKAVSIKLALIPNNACRYDDAVVRIVVAVQKVSNTTNQRSSSFRTSQLIKGIQQDEATPFGKFALKKTFWTMPS